MIDKFDTASGELARACRFATAKIKVPSSPGKKRASKNRQVLESYLYARLGIVLHKSEINYAWYISCCGLDINALPFGVEIRRQRSIFCAETILPYRQVLRRLWCSMDDFEGTYAPQSPDLSGFQTSNEPNTFSQTSYYPPQQQSHHFPNQYGPQDVNPESFNFNTHQFSAPHAQVAQDPYQSFTMPANGRSKASASYEDDYYAPDNPAVKGGSGRKSKKAKVEEDICDKLAPGVEEGIEVKTKFPVARIKRIMQADDDVGKVAQVTPTAVCEIVPEAVNTI